MTPEKGWITVFGSGRIKENDDIYHQSRELGGLLARQGFGVCTGGYGGVMEAAPRGAAKAGGKTAGVIIRGSRSKPNSFVQTIHEEAGWLERLTRLIEIGSGFAVMDGGIGTLNEFLMVWEMANKGLHQKPIVFLGSVPAGIVKILGDCPLVECPDRPCHASSPREAVRIFHEALGL